jgi:hypothetical protein
MAHERTATRVSGVQRRKALAEQPEHFTMNGHVAALTTLSPLKANVEKTHDSFVGGPNAGRTSHHRGNLRQSAYRRANTYVANEETCMPLARFDLEFKLNEPGTRWSITHCGVLPKGRASSMSPELEPDVYHGAGTSH